MSVIPYLRFQGTCREAMTYYADVFGTEIEMMMTGGEMPDFTASDHQKDLIAHASMKVAGGDIYASDDFMGDTRPMAGCSVMVSLPDNAASQDAFDKLANGGTVTMPFQQTFWSAGFGTVTDRFGIQWMVSSAQEPG